MENALANIDDEQIKNHLCTPPTAAGRVHKEVLILYFTAALVGGPLSQQRPQSTPIGRSLN